MNISILDSANRTYDLYLLESIGFDIVAGDVDIKAPVLNDMTITTNTYDPVNLLYPHLELDIVDDNSGFKDGSITFRDKKNANNKTYSSIRISDDGKFITDPRFNCNGTYDIESIYLVDNTNNDITYYNPNYLNSSEIYTNEKAEKDFSKYSIESINTGNEYEETIINIDSIVNNKKNITNGNEIDIEFMGDNDIPYDFSSADFECINPNEDIKGPEFLDVTLDKNIVLPGDKINFSLKVKDDKSGINDSELPSINYSNGSGYIELDVQYTNHDKSTGVYEGVITIPTNVSAGPYEPSISIKDNAGNYGYLSSYDSSKELYRKATLVIKNDLSEPLPPVIDSNIGPSVNEKFTLPFKPFICSDHGNVEMELNGKPYTGEVINAIGNYSLYVKAIGLDGSVSTKLLKFKVIGQMGNSTKPVDVVKDINNSIGNEIEFFVNSDSKEIDSTIFTAIKNNEKTAELSQADGTSWMFDAKNISLDKVTTINLKVSNSAGKEIDNKIDELDPSAKIINFNYEGELPGQATVKTRVNKTRSTTEDLTLYSYEAKTGKIKKVQDKVTIDDTGFVEMTVSKGSTYFLSAEVNLANDVTTDDGSTDKDDTEDSDKDNEINKGENSGNGQGSSDNKGDNTTDKNNSNNGNGKQTATGDNFEVLPLVILLLSSGIVLTRKFRKVSN